MPALPGLSPLSLDLVKQASLAGARAFADDPTTLYLIPNPKKRPNLRYAFEYYLRLSVFDHEEAYVTSVNCEGVAIWVNSEAPSCIVNTIRAGWPWLSLRCGWIYLFRDAMLERRYEKMRKILAPKSHLYLALLAVEPAFQGQGYASRLVRPMLARLDAEQLPAYLETQNLKNVAMYKRYGFNLIHEDTVPGADFTMYLMVRQPGQGTG